MLNKAKPNKAVTTNRLKHEKIIVNTAVSIMSDKSDPRMNWTQLSIPNKFRHRKYATQLGFQQLDVTRENSRGNPVPITLKLLK